MLTTQTTLLVTLLPGNLNRICPLVLLFHEGYPPYLRTSFRCLLELVCGGGGHTVDQTSPAVLSLLFMALHMSRNRLTNRWAVIWRFFSKPVMHRR